MSSSIQVSVKTYNSVADLSQKNIPIRIQKLHSKRGSTFFISEVS